MFDWTFYFLVISGTFIIMINLACLIADIGLRIYKKIKKF